jgi:hypothetical protein
LGRILTVSDIFPIKKGTIVNCIPSFVPETNHPAESKHTVVPCVVDQEKLYPIEVWKDISFADPVTEGSNVMGCSCCLRTDTRFPIQTDDRIPIITEKEVHLEQMKLAELRNEDEIRLKARPVLTMKQAFDQGPPRAVSCDALSPAQAFIPPVPQSTPQWANLIHVWLRDISGIQKNKKQGWVQKRKEGTMGSSRYASLWNPNERH